MLVTILMTENDGSQSVVGSIELRDGKLVMKPRGDGKRMMEEIMGESLPGYPLMSRGFIKEDRRITAAEPELFLRALQFQYNGSRLRAAFVE